MGERFRDHLGIAIAAIQRSPELYAVVHRDVRRRLIERFPYAVFYRVYPGMVVGGVMHARLIASLAWTLKAWFALLLPVIPRWREQHEADQTRVLRMDFRTFLQRLVLIPAQVLFQGRRLTIRLLGWRPELPILFRLLDAW